LNYTRFAKTDRSASSDTSKRTKICEQIGSFGKKPIATAQKPTRHSQTHKGRGALPRPKVQTPCSI